MIVMPIANIRFQGKETVEIKRFKIGALFYFKGESVSYKFSLMWIFAFYRMIGAFAITKNSFSKRDLCDETGEKRNISLFFKEVYILYPCSF